ncbi:MAG: AbrB family transcriptional regulator [Hyphomicrobiaceae bacterium]
MDVWAKRIAMIAAATAAGYIATLIGLPLPWMIGPLLLAVAFGLGDVHVPRHRYYRPVGQLVVATAVGLYFTPEALAETIRNAWFMVGAAVLTIAAGLVTAIMLRRLAHVDGTVAFFAAMPGGPAEMSVLAEKWGAQPAPVVFSQTLRIVFIVLLIPPLLTYVGGLSIPVVRPVQDVDLAGVALLYAIAATGTYLFRKVGVPNCNFLGPLAVGATISAVGLHLTDVPRPLLATGQILLGISLGAQFTRAQIKRDMRFAWAATITTVVLLVLTSGVALLLWLMTDQSFGGYLLATAPGSVTEMALTAKLLGQGVALVTAYHLVRIFIVIPLAPLLYRLFRACLRNHIDFGGKDDRKSMPAGE